jgi:hypothetical protein
MRGGQGVRGIAEGSWNGVSRLPRDFLHAKPVRVAKPKVRRGPAT